MKTATESLTRKYAAEFLSQKTNGKYEHDPKTEKPSQSAKPTRTKTSYGEPRDHNDLEAKLRRIVNFGVRFYSIAEASVASGIGESFIRDWIKQGKLTLLTHPDGKRRYVSGIELTDMVVWYNLQKLTVKIIVAIGFCLGM